MHKSGFVNIVGNPNVGKSTLMNALVGERISIITSKAQTTRHRILGIVNGDDFQIVYSDTPGVLKPNYRLQESMLKFSTSALADADVLLYVTDVHDTFEKNKDFVEKVIQNPAPLLLIINKIDLIDQERLIELVERWKALIPRAEIIPISALSKFNVERVFTRIRELLPESPPFFDKDQLTDKPARFFVNEIIREKILLNYDKEIPYSVEVEVEQQTAGNAMLAMGIDIDLNEMMGGLIPPKKKKRRLPVKDARRILIQDETDKRIDMDEVIREAVEKAEQDGIIFIDEIDKIAAKGNTGGADVSREGVQRDILPIVEGSTVMTKYGPVKTDYMLFIAAGAFHVARVEDLIPELQGRFPVSVELTPLTKEDFINILTSTEHSLTRQYAVLLAVDNIDLKFTPDAIEAIAEISEEINMTSEDIGARRLHTVMEYLLEDISFNAGGGDYPLVTVEIDRKYVEEHLARITKNRDLKKYVL